MKINSEIVEYACMGGAFLGGGGGGSIEMGMKFGMAAISSGIPKLVNICDIPGDGTILTVSMVGAPGAQNIHLEPAHFTKAVEIFTNRGIRIDALISNENGGFATVNGWYQSAVMNLPVLDAPCNGRAHPVGLMGGMGLQHRKNYISCQAAAGGKRENKNYLLIEVSGNIEAASEIIRQASISCGGMVAVARNPVDISWVMKNAATGAIRQAIEIGKILLNESSQEKMVSELNQYTGGRVLDRGSIEDIQRKTEKGFDLGVVNLSSGKDRIELSFLNEYICLEKDGERLVTFPDLITLIDAGKGRPVSSAEASTGNEVLIYHVPGKKLKLGSGMKDLALYRRIEEVLKKNIIRYMDNEYHD